MMNWPLSRCGATQQGGFARLGDIDIASALYQASCEWDATYVDDANAVITNVENSSNETCDGKLLLNLRNCGRCNGSERHTSPFRLATRDFEILATITGDQPWTSLCLDRYTHLATRQNELNSFVPRSAGDGGPCGPDVSRTPGSVVTDDVQLQDARAITSLDNVYDVQASGGIGCPWTPHSNYRGALSLRALSLRALSMTALPMGALQKNAAAAQQYADAWLTTSVEDESYFPGTSRPVHMLLLATPFPHECH